MEFSDSDIRYTSFASGEVYFTADTDEVCYLTRQDISNLAALFGCILVEAS